MKNNAKRVMIKGSVDLSKLNGIRDKKEMEGSMEFLYHGDFTDLIRCLAKGNITDISITEPDLEEIFLHYYENGGEAS